MRYLRHMPRRKAPGKRRRIGDVITNEIVELLSVSSLDASELITSLKNGIERERIETIRILLDAGKIKSDGVVYYL